jgi:hypothetical protein
MECTKVSDDLSVQHLSDMDEMVSSTLQLYDQHILVNHSVVSFITYQLYLVIADDK